MFNFSKACFSSSLKSSDFLSAHRDYKYTDESIQDSTHLAAPYEPAPETIIPPQSEHTRDSLERTNTVKYLRENFMVNYENYITPQSAYFAMNIKGQIYHVFDARRMTIGRIANRAAKFLQGKHKPVYDPKKMIQNGDNIVVVNAGRIKVSGDQYFKKVFRHHTEYAGGLHEILFVDLMQRDPQQLVRRVIKGMLPNNKTRKHLLEKVAVYREQYHDLDKLGIPQFINQPYPDPNELVGLPKNIEEVQKMTIIHESHPENPHPALKDNPREQDPRLAIPEAHYIKDFKQNPDNHEYNRKLKQYKHKLRKYSRHMLA